MGRKPEVFKKILHCYYPTLNADKCHKIHVGKCKGSYCPIVKAHNLVMEQVLDDSYLEYTQKIIISKLRKLKHWVISNQ